MSIPELDLKKVNLQSAVGYLISLHDNEVDWNLLGIRVIGAIDALPIPDGDYEYGDAYMVGTSTPYDMYIYTRPDGKVHTEGYWFPIGKFPTPGPQGPKGDGIEQISEFNTGVTQTVIYDTTNGAEITSNATIDYIDSTTGQIAGRTFTMRSKMPIQPGKYISIDANSASDAIEVKVDDTALSLDYFQVNKIANTVPVSYNGTAATLPYSAASVGNSLAFRDAYGNTLFNNVGLANVQTSDGAYKTSIAQIYFSCADIYLPVTKTSTDTGTLNSSSFNRLQTYPNTRIIYDNQVYICQDPINAPDGTLNYIHIDSLQDGSGRYKATGKCFSITVSTRAWQVIDIDFCGKATHHLYLKDNVSNDSISFTITNQDESAYTTAEQALAALAAYNAITIPLGSYSAGDNTAYKTVDVLVSGDGYLLLEDPSGFSKQYTAGQLTVNDGVVK